MLMPGRDPDKRANLVFFPALAMLFFFAGAFLFLEAAHFGLDLEPACKESQVLALLLAAGLLQFSVFALVFLPGAALLLGILSAAGAREMISAWCSSCLAKGLFPLTAAVGLFFLLFTRGMGQGALLYRELLEHDDRQKRELWFSCLIMLGLAGLFLLYRFIMHRY